MAVGRVNGMAALAGGGGGGGGVGVLIRKCMVVSPIQKKWPW